MHHNTCGLICVGVFTASLKDLAYAASPTMPTLC